VIADALLSRLQKVRGRNGSWVACCPAHEDKSPSLSIREDADRVLVHCFAGCSVDDVVAAVGLGLEDLFPPRQELVQQPRMQRVRLPATDVLRCLHNEALVVMVAAHNVAQGVRLTDEDRDRLRTAWQRIDEGLEAVNG
jgi:CHC2 zinc finger